MHNTSFIEWSNHLISPYKPLFVTVCGMYLTDINTVLGTFAVLYGIGYTSYCWWHKKEEIKKAKK